MATIFCNGCFDLLHPGHQRFLTMARFLGGFRNSVIVAINSDESAKKLKTEKWGSRYPINNQKIRRERLMLYADKVLVFDTEEELARLIAANMPCILCKGPDYKFPSSELDRRAHFYVTGESIAPVLILNTPETAEIKQLKERAYLL